MRARLQDQEELLQEVLKFVCGMEIRGDDGTCNKVTHRYYSERCLPVKLKTGPPSPVKVGTATIL